MILRRRVALNGVQLDSVNAAVIIQGIDVKAGKEQWSAVSYGAGDGSRATGGRRESLDINVRFTINEKSYRPQQRATILDAVKKWAAGGGVLTLNYKSGQQARVKCVQMPEEGDAGTRGQYTIVFRAYDVPYFVETTPTTKSVENVTQIISGGANITVNGSARTPLEFTFKNTSGYVMDTFSITIGGNTIALTGLDLANNSTLTLDHDEKGRQRIRVSSVSKMDCRTPESADELWADPGTVGITMTAGRAGNLTVKSYGRFA